jgi:hypothetical protein
VLDLEQEESGIEIDTTLSIEHILVAEALNEEQRILAEEQKERETQELYKHGGLNINPFEWAELHEGGGGGWE